MPLCTSIQPTAVAPRFSFLGSPPTICQATPPTALLTTPRTRRPRCLRRSASWCSRRWTATKSASSPVSGAGRWLAAGAAAVRPLRCAAHRSTGLLPSELSSPPAPPLPLLPPHLSAARRRPDRLGCARGSLRRRLAGMRRAGRCSKVLRLGGHWLLTAWLLRLFPHPHHPPPPPTTATPTATTPRPQARRTP